MSRPLRVVAHNGASVFGGCEIAVTRLLAGLRARGHDVLLLCGHELVEGEAARRGVPTRMLRLGGDAMVSDAFGFARELRRHRPDAVLLTTFRKVWLGGLGARMAGSKRVVLRIGLSSDVATGWKYRTPIGRWVDVVTVNSEDMRAPFLAGVPSLDPTRVVTIYKGVTAPPRGKQDGAVRRELGIPEGAPVVGALARLVNQKRFDRLIEAFAKLPASAHLVIAGEGEQREALAATAVELGVAGRLHLPGFRSDVGDVLAALDVLAVSSDHEGMCNVMLEAMASGVPVVSTPVAGSREAMEPLAEGVAPGVLVDFDAAELAAALARLLDDPDLRRRMADAGTRRVRERFDPEASLDRWEQVLSGAIA